MKFMCFTSVDPCFGLTAPDIIGSPLTAASWYLDTLTPEEKTQIKSVEVLWNDGQDQRQVYQITADARLVAL